MTCGLRCRQWMRRRRGHRSGIPVPSFALVTALLTMFWSGSQSQTRLLFEHLTVKEGLSQGSVTCILQDREGFMWLGTQDGLNRFDGYTFTVFRHDPADAHSLNENFIFSLLEDSEGTLWVGTVGNHHVLSRFDPVAETFTEVERDSVDLNGARAGRADSTYTEPSGTRWWGIDWRRALAPRSIGRENGLHARPGGPASPERRQGVLGVR